MYVAAEYTYKEWWKEIKSTLFYNVDKYQEMVSQQVRCKIGKS